MKYIRLLVIIGFAVYAIYLLTGTALCLLGINNLFSIFQERKELLDELAKLLG